MGYKALSVAFRRAVFTVLSSTVDRLKAMKYRLKPTKKQAAVLANHLEASRWLYNHLLEQRKTAWEERQELLSYHQQATDPPHREATASHVGWRAFAGPAKCGDAD